MSINPFTIPPETRIDKVISIFNKINYWSIYIVRGRQPIGVITRNDLKNRLRDVLPSDPIEKIMSTPVYSIDCEADVKEAISLIKQKRISSLAVTDKNGICGIITLGDINHRYRPKIERMIKSTGIIEEQADRPSKVIDLISNLVSLPFKLIATLIELIKVLFVALLAIGPFLYLIIYILIGAFTHQNSLLSSPIDDKWVNQFFSDVSAVRGTQYQYCPVLSELAELRYATSVKNYEISHYDYEADIQRFFGTYYYGYLMEEVLYPDNFYPSDYVENMKREAPIHWQGLMDPKFKYYGYYLGKGPTYRIKQPCPVTEITTGGINVTEFFLNHRCSISIVNATWFVIELASSCPG